MISPDNPTGARAVEVAAMLDDSVVTVKHVMNPRGGKVTTTTYALFAATAGLLLMAAVGFAHGVSNASFNKQALNEWTDVQGKALHDYRPRYISLGFDWMTFGGLAGGILALGLGLIRLRDEREQPLFRIGSEPDVDYPTADSPAPSFPLVAPAGDEFVLHYVPGMEGELIDATGQITPLAELQRLGVARQSPTVPNAMEAPIAAQTRFRIQSGNSTFTVAAVEPPRRHAVPLLASLESGVLGFFGASALVHFGFLALLWSIPPDPRTLVIDEVGGDARLGRVASIPNDDPLQQESIEADAEDTQEQPGGTGTKMALVEGKMGTPESARATGLYTMENRGVDPQLARERAMETAREAGILGAFRPDRGSVFASLTGTGDFSSGIDDRDIYGGLTGNEFGEMHSSVFGWGIRGTGPGGGGTGWGTIGTGRYGTIGRGDGTGDGTDGGSGPGGKPMRRKPRIPIVDIGPITQEGDLDKAIIRRHIRKKLKQIKYCYEKQLLVRPDLEGTVVTTFTISGKGAVISVQARGIGNTKVETCVAAAIKSIHFPAPTGGGLVSVRYPFIFRAAGK